MTQPNLLDLYRDEEYLSAPGVVAGLLDAATQDDPSFRILDRGDGNEGVFYRTEAGMQYFLGNRPRKIPVEPDPNGELPGIEFVTSAIDPLADVTPQQFLRGTGETAALLGKGMAQGFFGLPGDIESILQGIFANLDAPAVQRIQRSPAPFLRAFYELASAGIDFDTFAKGLELDTFLPTVKDVGEVIDKLEVMPEMQRFDKAGVDAVELIGEVLAPAGYVRMGQQAGQAVKAGVEQVKKAVTKRRRRNKIEEPQQELTNGNPTPTKSD